MQRDYDVPIAVQMASSVMEMHHELQRLRRENAELLTYRKRYLDLLNGSIAHNDNMMHGLLSVLMTPGVMKAVESAKE